MPLSNQTAVAAVAGARRLCYKGVSAVARMKTPVNGIPLLRNYPAKLWDVLLGQLSVADNVEAGHYMERLWCPLAAAHMAAAKQHEIVALAKRSSDAASGSGGVDVSGEAAEEEERHGRWWVHHMEHP